MQRANFAVITIMAAVFVLFVPKLQGKSLPPYPSVKSSINDKEARKDKESRLFEYAKRENPGLQWDKCLAAKAFERARKLAGERYFEHKNPKTGNNPAWIMVASCLECKYAGENLSKGLMPASAIHDSFMESPTHRRNILDQRYSRMGVGCYEHICVELFAGW